MPTRTESDDHEALLRWHFTNAAQELGYSRRHAELMFRNNYDKIVRRLQKAGLDYHTIAKEIFE